MDSQSPPIPTDRQGSADKLRGQAKVLRNFADHAETEPGRDAFNGFADDCDAQATRLDPAASRAAPTMSASANGAPGAATVTER